MKAVPTPVPRPTDDPLVKQRVVIGVVLFAATAAAYSNSLTGPFVFDAIQSITSNSSIHHLGHLARILQPPHDLTTSGRPILNLSLALDYALSGTNVVGYHVTNFFIHFLAGLTLWGILRRSLGGSPFHREGIAAAGALLWLLHPLQTESVTYVIQRAESLMGLWFLLSLYAFIRSTTTGSTRAAWWRGLSFAACLLGVGTKEVMAMAPVLILLYDRTFVAGTFRRAWLERRGYYLSLAATWLVLAYCIATTGGRNGTVGFATGLPWWRYGLVEFTAVARYLWLSICPIGLTFYYGTDLDPSGLSVAASALLVLALLASTGWLVLHRPKLGFLGAWFFIILAPTSTVVPIASEPVAEHRMYLSLAAIVVGLLLLVARWSRPTAIGTVAVLALTLGALTWARNQVYATSLGLWSDTVTKAPGDFLSHNNLAVALTDVGRDDEAFREYGRSIQLKSNYPSAYLNLAHLEAQHGRSDQAAQHFHTALELDPNNPAILLGVGSLEESNGRLPEAVTHLRRSLALDPENAEAEFDLANAEVALGDSASASGHFERALELRPAFTEAELNFGNLLLQSHRPEAAIVHYQRALAIKPGFADAHYNLGAALRQVGQLDAAREQFRIAHELEHPRPLP